MITLYGGPTTNTHKITIALEELGLVYKEHYLSLPNKEQLQPWFVEMSPNHKFPLLIDDKAGISVWESAAILIYLCETYDDQEILLHKTGAARYGELQSSIFQAANIGPTLGRFNDQLITPEGKRNADMLRIFYEESVRLTEVLDRMLKDGRPYLAGDYSIADVMHYPWLKIGIDQKFPELIEKPRITTWIERIADRPAVKRGMSAFNQ